MGVWEYGSMGVRLNSGQQPTIISQTPKSETPETPSSNYCNREYLLVIPGKQFHQMQQHFSSSAGRLYLLYHRSNRLCCLFPCHSFLQQLRHKTNIAVLVFSSK